MNTSNNSRDTACFTVESETNTGMEAYIIEIDEYIEGRRELTEADFGLPTGERMMFTVLEHNYTINIICPEEIFGRGVSSVEATIDIHDFAIEDSLVCHSKNEGWFYLMSPAEIKLVLEHVVESEIFRLRCLLDGIRIGGIEPSE